MEDLITIDKCISVSELIQEVVIKDVEDNFDSIYNKIEYNNESEYVEGFIAIDKSSKTAIVTPVVRKKHLVDYEVSDSEEENVEDKNKFEVMKTPHPKADRKTSKFKNQRCATPHVKKFLTLMRQKAVEDYVIAVEEEDNGSPKTTPSRGEEAGKLPVPILIIVSVE